VSFLFIRILLEISDTENSRDLKPGLQCILFDGIEYRQFSSAGAIFEHRIETEDYVFVIFV